MNEYYIAPETNIYVLTGVPLDNTYEHTISWTWTANPREAQAKYFASKAKYTFDKCTYERRERLWCKVERKADDLYDCNYMMFRNSAFGDKWFYAFILSVEYVNNNTSRIAFEIDVMQTWLRGAKLDYIAEMCYVERSHTPTDTLYEHLVPEDVVKADEYMVDDEIDLDYNDMLVVICSTERFDGEFTKPKGAYIGGVFGAIDFAAYSCKTAEDLQFIMTLVDVYIKAGKQNSIVSIQMCPKKIIDQVHLNIGRTTTVYSTSAKLTKIASGTKLGGRASTFVPKNNKLYTYPFVKIRVNNEQGSVKDYAWELFSNREDAGTFFIEGTFAWQPGLVIYPASYKGTSRNMETAVTMENFPVCPWGGDAYLAWWAQNRASFALNAFGLTASAGAVIGGITSGNPMLIGTGVGGVATSLGKVASSLYDAKHRGNPTLSETNSNLLLPVTNNFRFVITRESLRPEMLQMYDSYFTRFGYARKRVMAPPELNRQRWTYVKTVGFEASGKINNTDSKKIAEIFDNGITFWRNPDEVGRYELPNNPLPQA